jgi:transmembrane sensor
MSRISVSTISALSDQAIDRVIRLHSGRASEADRAEARAWQNRSPSHRKAFAEAEQLWLEMGEAMLAKTSFADGSRRGRQWAGLAAGLLVLASLIQFSGYGERWFSDYYTGVGEQKHVTLADGSQVVMNTDTAFSIAFDDAGRHLTLHRGQAVFTVAKDAARPFEVAAGTAVVKALGTVFEVLVDGRGTRVTVEEHAVGIKGLHEKNYPESGRIHAGQQARYSPEHGLEPPAAIDAGQISAWRRGKLIFKNRPLGEVVTELDRYYSGRMLIVNKSLETLRVTGVFPTNDLEAAIGMISDILPVETLRVTPWLILLRGQAAVAKTGCMHNSCRDAQSLPPIAVPTSS